MSQTPLSKMPTISLPSKPNAPIAYELIEGDRSSDLLLVFLNSLGRPQSSWKPTINLLQKSGFAPKPRILTYDRYGQAGGSSASDPRQNKPGKEPGYAHTLDDVVDDLYELVHTVSADRHERIVFVCNSIGAHIARQYADLYVNVQGVLFLDSDPGSIDSYAQIWPDPDDPGFKVPACTSLEEYKRAYKMARAVHGSTAKNGEGFDRRGISRAMSKPDEPRLMASEFYPGGPWITVVGHDVEEFSRQEWENLKAPIGITAKYTQPVWDNYNKGLCRLTEPEKSKGPLEAPKSGHFIQVDNPVFVAEQLLELLKNVEENRQEIPLV